MMRKEELRVMENSKELWDKEPTDNGQRSMRLNAKEGYTCNLKNFFTKKKRISDPLLRNDQNKFICMTLSPDSFCHQVVFFVVKIKIFLGKFNKGESL